MSISRPGCSFVAAKRREAPASIATNTSFDREIDVFQAEPPFHLVERISAGVDALRGVAVNPTNERPCTSASAGTAARRATAGCWRTTSRNRVLWQRAFPTGTDSLAISRNGQTLFVPGGRASAVDHIWYVVSASTGEVTREIHAAPGPHNTIVSPDGKFVYLGPRNSRWLVVASTRTDRVVQTGRPVEAGSAPVHRRPGPRGSRTRPRPASWASRSSSLRTGRVPTPSASSFPKHKSLGTPSHGISLTPNGRTLSVIDVPNSYVHVYDVSQVRENRHVTLRTSA